MSTMRPIDHVLANAALVVGDVVAGLRIVALDRAISHVEFEPDSPSIPATAPLSGTSDDLDPVHTDYPANKTVAKSWSPEVIRHAFSCHVRHLTLVAEAMPCKVNIYPVGSNLANHVPPDPEMHGWYAIATNEADGIANISYYHANAAGTAWIAERPKGSAPIVAGSVRHVPMAWDTVIPEADIAADGTYLVIAGGGVQTAAGQAIGLGAQAAGSTVVIDGRTIADPTNAGSCQVWNTPYFWLIRDRASLSAVSMSGDTRQVIWSQGRTPAQAFMAGQGFDDAVQGRSNAWGVWSRFQALEWHQQTAGTLNDIVTGWNALGDVPDITTFNFSSGGATAAAVLGDPLPPGHYVVTRDGNDVEVQQLSGVPSPNPVGMIQAWPGATAPARHLPMSGGTFAKAAYPDLHALMQAGTIAVGTVTASDFTLLDLNAGASGGAGYFLGGLAGNNPGTRQDDATAVNGLRIRFTDGGAGAGFNPSAQDGIGPGQFNNQSNELVGDTETRPYTFRVLWTIRALP